MRDTRTKVGRRTKTSRMIGNSSNTWTQFLKQSIKNIKKNKQKFTNKRTTQTIKTKKRKQKRIIKTDQHRRGNGWHIAGCWGLTDSFAEHDKDARAPLQKHLGFAYINLAHTWNNFKSEVIQILTEVKCIVEGYSRQQRDDACCCCFCCHCR